MNYKTHQLTREQQQAIVQTVVRQFSDWKSIGEFANEIVARLERQLDTEWIVEYLAYYDKPPVREAAIDAS